MRHTHNKTHKNGNSRVGDREERKPNVLFYPCFFRQVGEGGQGE